MAGKFANIKFGMNDNGDQVKTAGQYQPRQTMRGVQDPDHKQKRRRSVPGLQTTDPQFKQDSKSQQAMKTINNLQDGTEKQGEQNDVDVIVKLSALKDLQKKAGFRK